jgi:HEAT repeat protein
MFLNLLAEMKAQFAASKVHRRNRTIFYVPLLLVFVSLTLPLQAAPIEIGTIQTLVSQRKVDELKKLGPGVLPVMARLYESSNEAERTNIAETFYRLGWKSEEAKRVLMKDVHTQNQYLRLQVQWALGRVSNDVDVVEVLLSNMQSDSNPLFRDKAACALAYDQIHLTEKQKVRLYQGLIQSLRDSKPDVRRIALLALSIQTGQTKNFNPDAPNDQREASIREWEKWLEEYKSNL